MEDAEERGHSGGSIGNKQSESSPEAVDLIRGKRVSSIPARRPRGSAVDRL